MFGEKPTLQHCLQPHEYLMPPLVWDIFLAEHSIALCFQGLAVHERFYTAAEHQPQRQILENRRGRERSLVTGEWNVQGL